MTAWRFFTERLTLTPRTPYVEASTAGVTAASCCTASVGSLRLRVDGGIGS